MTVHKTQVMYEDVELVNIDTDTTTQSYSTDVLAGGGGVAAPPPPQGRAAGVFGDVYLPERKITVK